MEIFLFFICLIITNIVGQSCSSMNDCSYNGICSNQICECFPQWKGPHCASLNLIPGSKNAGLQSVINGSRITSWGGSVVKDNRTNKYHMIAAEMMDYCGMAVWLSNSQIVHAVSDTFDGEYIRQEVVKGGELFSHEPSMVKALDTGELVVYYTHIYPPATYKYPCKKCDNGLTHEQQCPTTSNNDYGRNWDIPLPTKMIYTSNISDNNAWSDVIDLDNVTPDVFIDSNLVTYIFPNGSLIGIIRNDNSNTSKAYNFIRASNWKDNATYSYNEMLPYSGNIIRQYGEDPFIWYDSRYDVIHSIWHYRPNGRNYPNGIHAFSTDNGHTFQAFLDFNLYPQEWAYTPFAEYTDGTNYTFITCERPHLIMDDDGYTPLALTNGAGVTDANDYSVTILRPINQQ